MSFQPVKFYQTGTFTAGNRLLPPEASTVQADTARSNSLKVSIAVLSRSKLCSRLTTARREAGSIAAAI